MNPTPPQGPPVLLTGGDHQGLAALRCLARHGVPVYVCDHEHSIARYSKYCRGLFAAPPPSETDQYAEFLWSLGHRPELQGAVLIADSDEQVYAIAQHRDRLSECFRVSVPPWPVVENVYVKASTYQVAKKLGIPAPITHRASSAKEAVDLPIQYPVILKPSIRDHYYRHTKVKAVRVSGAEELERCFVKMQQIIPAEEILIQELVPGGPRRLYSAGVFFKEGRVQAGIVGRRSRQHPMDFGHATTFAELVELPELIQRAEKLLASIGYYGIAEVEFLHDARDDEFKLLEVNPRIWGWHLLAIANGVELPWYLYLDMVDPRGEKIVPARRTPPVKWVRMITDVPVVISECLKGRMQVREWWRSLAGPKQFSVWASDDPLPCVMEMLLTPYLYYVRGF